MVKKAKKPLTNRKKIALGVAAVLAVVMVGTMIYLPYSRGLFTPVENGWKAPENYKATIEMRGVPDKYEAACPQAGTVETITYTVTSTTDSSKTAQKTAKVYLPYDYSSEKQYNILYLIHGGGDDETKWLTMNHNKDVVDNLIYYGDIEPLIIVTPTFYYPDGFCEGADEDLDWDYDQFAHEMRNVLIPAIETKYSTYAGGNVSVENLVVTRTHRAMAGLSMGSMHTLNVGMIRSLDLFSWFGSFSGSRTEASAISEAIHSSEFEQYQIDYLFVTNGKFDMSYQEHLEMAKELEANDDKLTEGDNFSVVDIKNGSHDWPSWELALYDFLQIAFR